ncbi:MAG: JAB domain-containing protein [Deltaproteobacteria bacterium]|nr:JAB domain-containing protein [Deltaproteobacteria bacterium]
MVQTALGLPSGKAPEIYAGLAGVGGIAGLYTAGSDLLEGVLSRKACRRLDAMLGICRLLLAAPRAPRIRVDGPEAVLRLLGRDLALCPMESFWVVPLDARGRAIGTTCVAQGTLTSCLVHPREVFAFALRARAASVVLVHNHPSGDPTPSEEDENLTQRLTHAGALLGVPVVDHIVVGTGGYRSLGAPCETVLARHSAESSI